MPTQSYAVSSADRGLLVRPPTTPLPARISLSITDTGQSLLRISDSHSAILVVAHTLTVNR
jgi:hypothetical protein